MKKKDMCVNFDEWVATAIHASPDNSSVCSGTEREKLSGIFDRFSPNYARLSLVGVKIKLSESTKEPTHPYQKKGGGRFNFISMLLIKAMKVFSNYYLVNM